MIELYFIHIENVMRVLWPFVNLTESDDSDRPMRRLKPTCANSCVAGSKPLGCADDCASATVLCLRPFDKLTTGLALHHISIFCNIGVKEIFG
jgi:hypothetical protein